MSPRVLCKSVIKTVSGYEEEEERNEGDICSLEKKIEKIKDRKKIPRVESRTCPRRRRRRRREGSLSSRVTPIFSKGAALFFRNWPEFSLCNNPLPSNFLWRRLPPTPLCSTTIFCLSFIPE